MFPGSRSLAEHTAVSNSLSLSVSASFKKHIMMQAIQLCPNLESCSSALISYFKSQMDELQMFSQTEYYTYGKFFLNSIFAHLIISSFHPLAFSCHTRCEGQ